MEEDVYKIKVQRWQHKNTAVNWKKIIASTREIHYPLVCRLIHAKGESRRSVDDDTDTAYQIREL